MIANPIKIGGVAVPMTWQEFDFSLRGVNFSRCFAFAMKRICCQSLLAAFHTLDAGKLEAHTGRLASSVIGTRTQTSFDPGPFWIRPTGQLAAVLQPTGNHTCYPARACQLESLGFNAEQPYCSVIVPRYGARGSTWLIGRPQECCVRKQSSRGLKWVSDAPLFGIRLTLSLATARSRYPLVLPRIRQTALFGG